jgi:hypothetical protein
MVQRALRIMLRTAGLAIGALVEAEEDVVLVVAHEGDAIADSLQLPRSLRL